MSLATALPTDTEPAHYAAVIAALAAAGYPLSTPVRSGGYTPGPLLDYRTPDVVEVGHWDDRHSPWRACPDPLRARCHAVLAQYAAVLVAAGFAATVILPARRDESPYVAVAVFPGAATGAAPDRAIIAGIWGPGQEQSNG